MQSRRRFLPASAAGLATTLSGVSPQAFAQQGKTARIVVGFPAGGGTDVIARLIAEKLRGSYAPAVHYKGGAPALQDLLGGQIPVSMNPVGEVLPHVKSGKIRVLAVTGAKRSMFLPDVPNMVESGYKDIMVEAWLGFFVPPKTPADTVSRLATAIGEAARSDEVSQSFMKFGNEVSVTTGANFVSLVRGDIERWGPVVKASGFTAED